MTLTQAQMEKLLEDAPRRNAGDVWFDCPNCDEDHHETIWEYAWEVSENGELFYDGPQATAQCDCGASILVAWQPDGQSEMYWLNKSEFTTNSEELE